ncbi:hypothetical protein C8F04DRAFT_1278419 [Mycena alexandri]|uniref:CxC2-like cysteine cluster KDZ transposase-associated domain-containing protein n=1 Tax=Mycena alexandri TaxID=1745969 RepID=A0AAD6RYR2_9AGAR|nr:hypothetical protein C8F04DRAFT_1278419 [Mycena alexandri]
MSKKRSAAVFTEILQYDFDDIFGDNGPSFTSQSISNDTRRTNERRHGLDVPSPMKKKAKTNHFFAEFGNDFEYAFEDLTAPPPIAASARPVKSRAKRYLSSDATLKQFVPVVDEYLAEFLRLEGKGFVAREWCPACPKKKRVANPEYRCIDCFSPDVLCSGCCVARHKTHPLDRIEFWNGEFFERVSLKSLGLRIQMGHTGFETCDSPQPGHTDFTVVHSNGIHAVAVDFCGCENAHMAGTTREQTLRMSWFPATDLEPQTCATFRVVELFHILTLQGKVTTYDFYSGLEKLTDNAGLLKLKDRYKSFMRIMREWRHLVMVKRGGVGNDGKRKVAQTMPGELGPDCPGCPRPKVNIPDDWESATEEQRFLYILYIAIDACFRLKRRLVSSEKKDPSLGPGWSFFTEDAPYREYLLGVTDQKEMSTCSGLAALDYANTKFSRGYGSTGVGLGVCARHEFVQKSGAADLQKGERYANMDYIFASLMRHHDARLFKFISYDICCQWSKHLIGRLKKLPARIRLTLVIALVRFLIPKLHIYGHKIQCQLYFSLNYTPGSARTDGEGIERPWANIGPVATSTREMGPGSRQDTLNDHWSHWNWQKLVGLGALLKKRLLTAIPERNFQAESLATFTSNQMEHVPQWKAAVEAFEADSTKPNPYEIPKSGASEHDVRLECAQEEAADQVAGIPAIHNVSPSAFILAGLDLEEQQRQIKIEVLTRRDQSTKQSAELVEKRTKLSRYIARFRALQIAYTPAALQALADRPAPSPDKEEEAARVENVPLFLPSALTEDQRATGCNRGVVGIETRLRDAQCRSALDEIRNLLHVKSRFRTYKGGNKLRSFGEKYVAAWEAKRRLVGEANVGWRRLNPKKDLRCMESEDDAAQRSKRKVRGKKRSVGQGATEEERREGVQEGQRGKGHASEGRRTVSWIWMGVDSSSPGTSEAILTGLRAEWAKAWARTRRWTEEVTLLKEEMRRVPVALRWKAEWWRERREVEEFAGYHAEGARAYASRQAALMERIAVRFELMWEGLRELEEVQSASAEAEGQQDEEERDDDEENWVAAESEGEGGIEGEDEEGSIGEGDDEGDDED